MRYDIYYVVCVCVYVPEILKGKILMFSFLYVGQLNRVAVNYVADFHPIRYRMK
jgi:hypothetical protein